MSKNTEIRIIFILLVSGIVLSLTALVVQSYIHEEDSDITSFFTAACPRIVEPVAITEDTFYPEELKTFIEASYFNTDTNHDNFIDKAEMQKQIILDFNTADIDKDGLITLKDIYSPSTNLPSGTEQIKDINHHMPGYDLNSDMQIDLPEYVINVTSRYSHMDANQDGYITLDEAHNFHKQ
ncbi:MAG: hypothetical protein Q8P90_02560 [bacterium]|nr:hypothetical protein [bacterium]